MESITVKLEPHYELLADLSTVSDKILKIIDHPLEHQIRTYQKQKEFDLILNTFPTGTGKTKASLLYLLDQPLANTLFIAPTNELITQHFQDVQEFVKNANLDHVVVEVNAQLLRKIDPANSLRRQGERFYRLMTNPMEFAEELNIPEEKRFNRCPVILITNPDLFYYALYSCYNNLDKRNVFETMLSGFEYIIIDEFHYYNSKQLANFLFFLALSLEFGYFESETRKVCLLSATPDAQVYRYLERLASQGLNWKAIEPEFVDPSHPRAIKTLAPVNLTLIGCQDLTEYLQLSANQVKDNLKKSLDGALISNSLIDINRSVNILKSIGLTADQDFGRITGAVSRRERKISAKKPLIVATPTVDIGYNFVKEAKSRQNLDFAVFTAKYSDEFWQRLGRVGRVLGKLEQNFLSDAITIVSPEVLTKISQSAIDWSTTITRDTLKTLLINSVAFPQKPFLYEYISSYAVLESFRPLYELKKQMRNQERIKDVFEQVKTLFAPNSKKNYQHYVYQLCRFNSLQAAIKGNYSDHLIREFLSIAHYWSSEQGSYSINENTFKQFKQQIENKNPKCIKPIGQYVAEEYYALSSLFSFRDSFQSLTCAVYDPNHIITDVETIAYYDLLHLLKYYDLSWFKSVEEFKETIPNSDNIQFADIYCQVQRAKNREENLIVSFRLESEFNQDIFKKRYCDKQIAIKGLKIQLSNLNGSSVALSPKLTEAIQEQYITCLLVPEQGGDFGEIKGKTRDIQLLSPTVKVIFSDSKQLNYKAILGTNAYLLGARIQKYLYALEKKTDYWIC